MQRELRFRMWSNEKCFKIENGKTVEKDGCYVSTVRLETKITGELFDLHGEDVTIEQYIGLDDVEGVPIYENDIIQASYVDYDAYLDEYATHYPTRRIDGAIFFDKGSFYCGRQKVSSLHDIKIIGNIHTE
jgi:uncharacterized phage protein (TIGR01671 family)